MRPNRGMLVATVIAVSTVFGPSTARADGSVSINLSADGQTYADALGIDVQNLEGQLNDRLQEAFDLLRLPKFLQAFSDAASFSNRGIGVDYASNTRGVIVGVAANIAVGVSDSIDNQDADQPAGGVAPNVSIMLGANMKKLLDMPQLMVFVNGFHRSGSFEDELDASITSAGLHAQYKVLRNRKTNKKNLILMWGGIDLTSGLEYSRLSLDLRTGEPIQTDLGVTGNQGESPVQLSSTGSYSMNVSALTVPFEATTNLRFLYLLSLYGGVGFDLQLGGSDLSANLDGTMTGTDPLDGSQVNLGTARVQISEDNGPSTGRARVLGGLQLNIWKLKAFVQGNYMPNRAASVAFGARLDI